MVRFSYPGEGEGRRGERRARQLRPRRKRRKDGQGGTNGFDGLTFDGESISSTLQYSTAGREMSGDDARDGFMIHEFRLS